jgi:hypothetical protein
VPGQPSNRAGQTSDAAMNFENNEPSGMAQKHAGLLRRAGRKNSLDTHGKR